MKVILRKFIFVFLCSSLLLACDRENEKWAYYNETQCADPWEAATSDNELLSVILKSKTLLLSGLMMDKCWVTP
jgi:hypothetical protein